MTDHRHPIKRSKTIPFFAFCLASVSCLLGLTFCLIKSPMSKSHAYIAASADAMSLNRGEDAIAAAFASVQLDPSNVRAWQVLAQMLTLNGRGEAALHALDIADRLQHGLTSDDPVYALPAEFRLSLLGEKDAFQP